MRKLNVHFEGGDEAIFESWLYEAHQFLGGVLAFVERYEPASWEVAYRSSAEGEGGGNRLGIVYGKKGIDIYYVSEDTVGVLLYETLLNLAKGAGGKVKVEEIKELPDDE